MGNDQVLFYFQSYQLFTIFNISACVTKEPQQGNGARLRQIQMNEILVVLSQVQFLQVCLLIQLLHYGDIQYSDEISGRSLRSWFQHRYKQSKSLGPNILQTHILANLRCMFIKKIKLKTIIIKNALLPLHTHTHTRTHARTHARTAPENCLSVCNFQYKKSLIELRSLFLKFFCYTSCLMRLTTGGLANEGFTPNHIVSLTQQLIGLKTTN